MIFRIRTTGAYTTGSCRTESLETVTTKVVTSIRHWIVLFCERCCLAGVGGRGCARKEESGKIGVCDGHRVVDSPSKSVSFGCVSFYELCCCDHWVLQFEVFSILINRQKKKSVFFSFARTSWRLSFPLTLLPLRRAGSPPAGTLPDLFA